MIYEKLLFELGIRTAYIKNGILHIDQFGNGNYIQDNKDNISISDYGTHYIYFLINNWNKLIYPVNIIHPIKSYEGSLIELINRSDKKDR